MSLKAIRECLRLHGIHPKEIDQLIEVACSEIKLAPGEAEAWDRYMASTLTHNAQYSAGVADAALAERRKRYP